MTITTKTVLQLKWTPMELGAVELEDIVDTQ
jgi:hypothetical protein